VRVRAGLAHRLFGSYQRELGETVEHAQLRRVEMRVALKHHRGGQGGHQTRCKRRLQSRHAAVPGTGIGPQRWQAVAQRRDHAHAGDGNSSHALRSWGVTTKLAPASVSDGAAINWSMN
jgi:hypothetical protein